MRVFLQSIFGQLLLTLYIGLRGYQVLPQKKYIKLVFLSALLSEVSVFLFGWFLHRSLPDYFFIPIMKICNTWYISSIYLAIGFLIAEPFRLRKNIKRAWYSIVLLGVIFLMIHAYSVVAHPITRHLDIYINKTTTNRKKLRVAFMADLHMGEVVEKKWVKHYVDMCNTQKPDIILIGGDLIDYESRFVEQDHIEDVLQKLNAPLGVYTVLGNHEYRANRFAKIKWIKKTGITLLKDEVIMPDSSFIVIGRDDRINRKRKTLQQLTKKINKKLPIIVLDHQPEALSEVVMNKVDLGLYGHTHGGQLFPFSLLTHFAFECPYGLYQKGTSQFYITSGIGIAGPPFRIGTVSELVIIDIHFTKKKN